MGLRQDFEVGDSGRESCKGVSDLRLRQIVK